MGELRRHVPLVVTALPVGFVAYAITRFGLLLAPALGAPISVPGQIEIIHDAMESGDDWHVWNMHFNLWYHSVTMPVIAGAVLGGALGLSRPPSLLLAAVAALVFVGFDGGSELGWWLRQTRNWVGLAGFIFCLLGANWVFDVGCTRLRERFAARGRR